MSESEYWDALRFRINCLPSSSAPRSLLSGWCDWFEPKRYLIGGPSPRITGNVGFVNGGRARQRRFTLLVGCLSESHSEVEWAALIPSDDSDEWLSLDESGELIVIDPQKGVSS